MEPALAAFPLELPEADPGSPVSPPPPPPVPSPPAETTRLGAGNAMKTGEFQELLAA